jgi:hypothetical protein
LGGFEAMVREVGRGMFSLPPSILQDNMLTSYWDQYTQRVRGETIFQSPIPQISEDSRIFRG